jgi:D-threo-aldose 1-dehydrogenase
MTSNLSRPAGWPFARISLGTGTWPQNSAVSQDEAAGVIRTVLLSPHPFFDTAPLYGSGRSENWLGTALRGVSRDSFRLASKAGYALLPDGTAKTDLSRDGILRSVEGSLERLGVSWLDIVHVHDPDCCLREALDVAIPTLCGLREQGVIRAVGAGMNQWEMLLEFARHADVDCFLLAGRYTLLEQAALPLLDVCRAKGLAVFLGGVYNTGILATGSVPNARYNYRPAPPEVMARVRALEAACGQHGVPLQAAALQFPLAHPAVRSLVIGADSPAQFASATAAVDVPIPTGLWTELHQQGLISHTPSTH